VPEVIAGDEPVRRCHVKRVAGGARCGKWLEDLAYRWPKPSAVSCMRALSSGKPQSTARHGATGVVQLAQPARSQREAGGEQQQEEQRL